MTTPHAPAPARRGGRDGPGCGHTAAEHAAFIRDALARHDLDTEVDAGGYAVELVLLGADLDDALDELTALLAAPSGSAR